MDLLESVRNWTFLKVLLNNFYFMIGVRFSKLHMGKHSLGVVFFCKFAARKVD